MIIPSIYKGTIFYIIPMPFLAYGHCEVCDAFILLIGLSIGKNILTCQIHFAEPDNDNHK
jgi:hypothetical protein